MPSIHFAAITSTEELQALADKLLEDGLPVAFDLETGYSGAVWQKGERKKMAVDIFNPRQFVAGFSITNSTRWARYVPVAHDNGPNIPEDLAWAIIKPVLEELPVIAHNAKFEILNCRLLDLKGRGPRIDINLLADTQLEAFILSEWPYVGLKEMVRSVFGHEMVKIEALFPDWTKEKITNGLRFNVLELTPQVISYACEDAAWTLALHNEIGPRSKSQRATMWQLEHEIVRVLCDMEEPGIEVDWEGIAAALAQGQTFVLNMEKMIRKGLSEWAGRDMAKFNLNSPKQLKELLYRDMGLKTTVFTDTADKRRAEGAEEWEVMSTNEIALTRLANETPSIKKILEYREVKNLLKRCETWLSEFRTSHDDRVHASYKQTVIGSGRFAAGDPAVQQLPKKWGWTYALGFHGNHPDFPEIVRRGTNGKEYWKGNFRDFIVAGPDRYLLGYDYSQIELRVLAGESQEPALLDAFDNDKDIHTITAAVMLGKDPSQVDPDTERPIGKTMNFALLYGMKEKSLSERLDISMAEAQDLYAAYFAGFSMIDNWMSTAKNKGLTRGYVETKWKRKYTVWELQSSNRMIYSKGERVCANVPIQGGAADYMKIAMVRASKMLKKRGWWLTKVRLVHNLHDALTFEVDNDLDPREVRGLLQEAVVFPVEGFPKIVADWELGQRWGSCPKWNDEDVVFEDGQWRIVPPENEDFSRAHGLSDASHTPPLQEEDDESPGQEPEIPSVYGRGMEAPLTAPTISAAQPASGPAKTLMVEAEQVTDIGFGSLLDLLYQHAGLNTVILKTKEGELELDARTSLDLEDRGRFSLALGGAKVYYPSTGIDLALVAKGLSL